MESEAIGRAFGRTLRRLRTDQGMTQDALAFESGLDRSFLSKLENGHKLPTLSTMVRLANVLGITVSQLVDEFEREMEAK